MSTITDALREVLEGLGLPWWAQWISVVIVAMFPFVELRGALPIALGLDIDWGIAILLSIIGNLIPVPILMLFFGKVERFLRRWSIFEKFFNKLFESTRRKGERKIQAWGDIGLILFVAIPLPVTGAWTGTLVAYLLKLNRKKAFLCIFVGVVIAGMIMTAVSLVHWILGVLIVVFLAVVLICIWKIEEIRMKKNTSDEPSH